MQTLSDLIEGDYLYVDKTRDILPLIQSGKYYFLSRPRRFGKSLLVSTLKEIFSGNKELFKGLYMYDKIEWTSYPVIHLDFLMIPRDTEERLKRGIRDTLGDIAAHHNIRLERQDYDTAFQELITQLAEKYQKPVVVLIDEYDKPLVEHIENLDAAKKNRDILRNFYEMLKGSDSSLHFVFLTGVSKFSKVSIFSSLNNLRDITLSPQFATIVGYTQRELEQYFESYIQRFCEEESYSRQALLEQIKNWYNGYSWDGKETLYNPISILTLFAENIFANYWFATGTPTLLIKLSKQMKIDISEFEQTRFSNILFESYDIDNINLFALLLQTGYLTISNISKNQYGIQYLLNYPNWEVKEAFITYLFESFTGHNKGKAQVEASRLRDCLQQDDLEGFLTIMRALLAKIPYTLHIPEEAYYHSLFYMIAVLMGVEIKLEVLTDKGRVDGVLELPDKIYIIEFKFGKSGTKMDTLTKKAIRQIREKKYAEQYAHDSRPCWLLGIGFVDKEIGYELVKMA